MPCDTHVDGGRPNEFIKSSFHGNPINDPINDPIKLDERELQIIELLREGSGLTRKEMTILNPKYVEGMT